MALCLSRPAASHEGGECCVCEISPFFELSQPTVSHHLKTLREAGLLECERRGTWVHYWVIPAAMAQLSAVLALDTTPPAAAPGALKATCR
ncbi:ArsR/SmtB family transcription factor [Mycolicibacterium sp. CBM1]